MSDDVIHRILLEKEMIRLVSDLKAVIKTGNQMAQIIGDAEILGLLTRLGPTVSHSIQEWKYCVSRLRDEVDHDC
jgi:hypothetical protein